VKTLYERMATIEPEATTLLAGATVIRADNVAGYYADYQGDFFDDLQGFPHVVPPFAKTWIEYRLPAMLVGRHSAEIGLLATTADFRKQQPDSAQVAAHLERFPGTRWLTTYHAAYLVAGKPVGHPLTHGWIVGVQEGGNVSVADGKPFVFYSTTDPDERANVLDRPELIPNPVLHIALLALSFMHCKNVLLEAVDPKPRQPGKRNRHPGPGITYHTIKIRPTTRYEHGGERGQALPPSLHIRRGHFKTYTDAAPLLGKHVGTYWWEAAAVGKSDRRVDKTYDVYTPNAQAPD
jgi:hypothetical protein